MVASSSDEWWRQRPGDSGPGGAHGENLDDLRTNA
jgi:hypothetical protein